MKRQVRILHVLNTGQFSGAENVVCQIIGMFKNDDGIQMAYTSPDGPIREALEEREIKYYPMSHLCRRELCRVVKEYAPEIVHAHDIRATVLASTFPPKIKKLSTIHGNDIGMRSLNKKSILFGMASLNMHHIFWVSKSCLEQYYFRKGVLKKSSVLVNVIDRSELINKMQSDSIVYPYDIVFVGRISAPKNPQRLAKVLAVTAAQKQDVQAAIVGNGELETEMKTTVTELGIDNNVHFLGFQSNPLKILHDAKVMIMTSAWEGTPMCALEAMALGVPIVSTPTDGMLDLVLDGKTGYLSDDDSVLADKMLQIIQKPDLHKALSSCSEERFAEISDIGNYKKKLAAAYFD